jgi:tetratricopeptide (TPR) repeat protein
MNEAQRILHRPYPSYHPPLQAAKKWVRSGKNEQQREAVELLLHLRKRYPHVLAIGHELALALLESGQINEADRLLGELEAQFPNLDEETLCRLGRCSKELGDRCFQADDQNSAAIYYRRALAKYESANEVRHGHYPGINRSSLLHLLGRRAEAVAAAQELLARRDQWPVDETNDLALWHPATEAEARLLLEEWDRAAALYRAVQKNGRFPPHARDSMRRQVERILRGFHHLGVTENGPFQDLNALFPAVDAGEE